MWFKNLQLYRLPTMWSIGITNLRDQLARAPFVKCESNQPMSRGWVPPREGSYLAHLVGSQWLIALGVEQRLLPAAVVAKEVRERAAVIAEQQGYAPGRKQLRELKERVIEELMPRAFTSYRVTHAWIDPIGGWLCIDASTPSKAEEVIEHLRHSLDEFPLRPLTTELSPASAMADWLASGEAPPYFTIDRDCELKAISEEKATVRYIRCPLDDAEEIKSHLASGKLPSKLALTWFDRMSFVLTDKLEVKKLAFLDMIKEVSERNAEDAADIFDADFALMTGEISQFLPRLVEALGGEVQLNNCRFKEAAQAR